MAGMLRFGTLKRTMGSAQGIVYNNNFASARGGAASVVMRGMHIVHRHQLADPMLCRRVVVKLGSAVVTRQDECGLALGRLASVVEQVAELQASGREMVLVTSGAIAFGKQLLMQQNLLSRSLRQTLHQQRGQSLPLVDPRACSATGQGGLISMYEMMFQQYGMMCAQILVTKNDFKSRETINHLRETINSLINMKVIPIINENDAVAPPPQLDADLEGVLSVTDNDSLAANVATQIRANLMVILSDVDGIYSGPPKDKGSKLLDRYEPATQASNIQFGEGSKVGRGGMAQKVDAAAWCWQKGVSVVVANGMKPNTIVDVVSGKKVGTFFTNEDSLFSRNAEEQAKNARRGGRELALLSGKDRATIINRIADLLIERESAIMEANGKDMLEAERNHTSAVLKARLSLSHKKLADLAAGLKQIAAGCDKVLGRVVKKTIVGENLVLQQETVPIGVLLVIFESRPDALPQVAALAIASGNGLLLKGGKEAAHSNAILHAIVQEALGSFVPANTVGLINTRDEISELLSLDQHIDLVIPRGGNELVRSIQQQAKSIPVLGHADGICHVFLDKDANVDTAVRLVTESKCNYPSACNAMETLLIHKDIVNTPIFEKVLLALKDNGVTIHCGPRLHKLLPISGPVTTNFRKEYGDLQCAVEVVDDWEQAKEHIHKFGSSHTDAIITENKETAAKFLNAVDSSCVFHNASTRFSDGYRFGLGAEVGISTSRIHARGPVGVDGLLTTKWKLVSSVPNGSTITDFNTGVAKYTHEQIIPPPTI